MYPPKRVVECIYSLIPRKFGVWGAVFSAFRGRVTASFFGTTILEPNLNTSWRDSKFLGKAVTRILGRSAVLAIRSLKNDDLSWCKIVTYTSLDVLSSIDENNRLFWRSGNRGHAAEGEEEISRIWQSKIWSLRRPAKLGSKNSREAKRWRINRCDEKSENNDSIMKAQIIIVKGEKEKYVGYNGCTRRAAWGGK